MAVAAFGIVGIFFVAPLFGPLSVPVIAGALLFVI